MTNKKLNEKVLMLKELEQQEADITAQIESLKDELKKEMTSREVNELTGDDWKITWNTIQSNRFDQSAFKSAHPELFKEFTILSESKRFILR